MSIVEAILKIFLSGKADSYREMRRQLFYPTLPRYSKPIPKKEVIASTIWRLKNQGLIKIEGKRYLITEKGKQYLKIITKRIFNLPDHGGYHKAVSDDKSLIVIFDIPEKQKKKRHWLRIELKILNFEPLQKSVWVGHGPLPKQFIDKLVNIGIFDYIHIFEIKKLGTLYKE